MSNVSFFTAVTYPKPRSFTESLLEKCDDYFFLKGRKVKVVRENQLRKREGVEYAAHSRSSFCSTLLKVVSYFTVVLPLLVLIAKVLLRATHPLYRMPSPKDFCPLAPYLGTNDPTINVLTPRQFTPLPFGEVKALTDKEILPHRIQLVTQVALQQQPQILTVDNGNGTASAALTAPVFQAFTNKGYSDLEVYKDSYFHYYGRINGKHNVARVKIDDDFSQTPFIPFRKETEIDYNQFAALGLQADRVVGKCAIGTSTAPAYKGETFYWMENVNEKLRIYRA